MDRHMDVRMYRQPERSIPAAGLGLQGQKKDIKKTNKVVKKCK